MLFCQPWYDYRLKRICVIERRIIGETQIMTSGCPLRHIDEPVHVTISMNAETVRQHDNQELADPDPEDADPEDDDPEDDDPLFQHKFWDKQSRKSKLETNILRYITYEQLMAHYPQCQRLSFNTCNRYFNVDICTLTNQAYLKTLSICGCRLSGLGGIEHFSNLERLELHYCYPSGSLSRGWEERVSATTGSLDDLILLSGLPIENLWIVGTPVSPTSFLDLPRLRKITVSDKVNGVSSNHFECLSAPNTRLPMLEKITVRIQFEDDWINDEYKDELKQSLEKQHPGIIIKYQYD